ELHGRSLRWRPPRRRRLHERGRRELLRCGAVESPEPGETSPWGKSKSPPGGLRGGGDDRTASCPRPAESPPAVAAATADRAVRCGSAATVECPPGGVNILS